VCLTELGQAVLQLKGGHGAFGPRPFFGHGSQYNYAKEIVDAGANILVAGSAIFNNNGIERNINDLREAV